MGDKKTPQDRLNDVFITELNIKKVRHLKDIIIPLSQDKRKHLILTGKNGSGKTSVLMGIANRLNKFELRLLPPSELSKLMISAGDTKLEFNSGGVGKLYSTGHFLLAVYAAKRKAELVKPSGLNKIDLREYYEIDHQPGKQFIQYMVNLKAEKSFARDDHDLKTVEDIERWFDTFENSLREIFEDPSLKLEFDRRNYNYNIIQKGKETFDFNTMADGYAAIINVVTDLILRMEKHKTKSYDVQGIVLIDELEAHLHIDLQKKIFPFLTRFFPRIQFIVTTHSPFVINSIENAVIYDLEKNLLMKDLSNYSYEGIVEGYFDNDNYSQEAKGKIELYRQLVEKKKRTEKEQMKMMELRTSLNELPSSLAPELKARFQEIELNRTGRPHV
ncbi:MAG: AAA family ATPase [bacterium]|nr:AAA family ATPase [bacterium]